MGDFESSQSDETHFILIPSAGTHWHTQAGSPQSYRQAHRQADEGKGKCSWFKATFIQNHTKAVFCKNSDAVDYTTVYLWIPYTSSVIHFVLSHSLLDVHCQSCLFLTNTRYSY